MIYLDHAAATPVSAKALKAMEPYFATEFFNPSAAYLPAKKVAADYEAAKDTIAHAVGAKGTVQQWHNTTMVRMRSCIWRPNTIRCGR